jgi:3-methyladenine DNA glycosylase AlkD
VPRCIIERLLVNEVVKELQTLGDPAAVAAMARFGIHAQKALGISTPKLRALARRIGRDHTLAQQLWKTGILEARVLATLIADPTQVTESLMESWAKDFDSWAVCDAGCCNLFDKTKFAWRKAIEWSRREEEYVKRAGFALMAALAVHNKSAPDEKFLKFLPAIRRGAIDDRNFVKKGVNWALRQIGKRNRTLHRAALETARRISALDSRAARWIAADALRELESDAVERRLRIH